MSTSRNATVELIVAQLMQDIAPKLDLIAKHGGPSDGICPCGCGVDLVAESLSRSLLANIAANGCEEAVFAALAAVGAPATPADLKARLAASREQQAAEAARFQVSRGQHGER